jgi:hypothetical protein
MVGRYQLTPSRVNIFMIGQECHSAFDRFDAFIGFEDREAKTVAVDRTGRDILKLSDVLEREIEFGTLSIQFVKSCLD